MSAARCENATGAVFFVEPYAGECTRAAVDKADQHDRDLGNGKEGSNLEVSWLL